MPVTIDDVRIRIGGPDFEPADPAWQYAPPSVRIAHWTTVAQLAVRRIRSRLRRGLDRLGRPLASVRYRRPDPDGSTPTGPPLTPHRAESRFLRYLRLRATERGCTIYWGQGWARVVRGHKEGYGALPVRDVVGLTPADERYVRAESRAVWLRRNGGPVRLPAPRPTRARGA